MSDPKVSVIIPNYNHARYLRQRIETVLSQTYRNFEVIILDDCSTDSSREIIESYRGHSMVTKIIYNENNSGSPFRQWRKGLQVATGQWIWIAESDDYADEKFLATMLFGLHDCANVGLIYCDSFVVRDETVLPETFAPLKNRQIGTSRWSESHCAPGIEEIANYVLRFGTINNTSAVLFRRDLLVETDPFDIDLKYIGDKYAFIKVLSKSNAAYINAPLNYYRNPFNSKHSDKLLGYFFEQFLIFNWVDRHVNIPGEKFNAAFYEQTQFSFLRHWRSLHLYVRLFRINGSLVIRNIFFNLIRPFRPRSKQAGR
ncbi:MAG TPA: glycosyltransferase [Chryseosolibacter sp.]|nr:glycosyltransferase [Chryseosolibacter sp.]